MLTREKVLGCWLGKAVGGTLGQNFEGLEGPLEVDFYTPVPTEMIPNDDLDLQVLYAVKLAEQANPSVDRHWIADAWRRHVEFPWNEYGVGLRNLAEGLTPPHTGSFDNWFSCGEGAAIRSELWACLAAGDPDRAAAYAYEDACFDHAGDGIHAAVFLARMQALAFVVSDLDALIDCGLEGVPRDSELRRAVEMVRSLIASGANWIAAKEKVDAEFARDDFTDVRVNTAYVILGLLAGADFSERILITNNCGADTDSTTASLGALLGIMDPSCIDERWLAPIGRDLVLSEEVVGILAPPTLDDFTDLVLDLSKRLDGAYPPPVDDSSPAGLPIPVRLNWTNTIGGRWDIRDLSELPPEGAPPPAEEDEPIPCEIPGTWMQLHQERFEDRILLLRYSLFSRGRARIRLMINSTVEYRVWIDGNYVHGAQGSRIMMPAPHAAPFGQAVDLDAPREGAELLVAFKRPPRHEPIAEWVVAVAEPGTGQWIPHALRP
ncbi:ADP-ribosylglycohydrolase family protein [Microbacterium sp. 4R-513]|uniref:ADP-ribosylglycohydrolase family protein n=1 Tax=Microbacterium sp. 4R-513 TaxID=2567934 RepID=UPI0013E0F9E7|nr:ADP-ribosylglycohydrolase family protein [Microbacterium sp. 4R-513]QIG39376.1 ADP-ribosylglycohydrolase family protein [Microbacterium sp. 4R-513]